MALHTSRSKSAPQVVGNYEIVEKIAEGGMGTVYKARQRETGQVVAIKMVSSDMLNNTVLLKRFENEFRAASTLDHPNIVRALDFGTADGRPYLVMEFVDGESLGQKLERDGRMSEAEAVRIIALAAEGLEHAHKNGMIHRDVKPDNIMLANDGQAKLADLGLVKDVDAELNLTRTGRGLGTPHFMAPEQFRNAKNADVRCDIYSLAATLYMMVTGELPFRSLGPLDAWMKKVNNDLPPPRKLVPELSERTDAAIRRAMHPDPKQRPESCREFVEDLAGQGAPKVRQAEASAGPQELWYLFYKDDAGVTHTVKGTANAIRRSLKEGLLGDASNVRACRTKAGPFEPLRSHPEFRDLVASANSRTPTRTPAPATPLQVPVLRAGQAAGAAAPNAADSAPPTEPEGLPSVHLDVGSRGRSASPEWVLLVLSALIAMGIGLVVFWVSMMK
jgi:serine/threonine protein kinase